MTNRLKSQGSSVPQTVLVVISLANQSLPKQFELEMINQKLILLVRALALVPLAKDLENASMYQKEMRSFHQQMVPSVQCWYKINSLLHMIGVLQLGTPLNACQVKYEKNESFTLFSCA